MADVFDLVVKLGMVGGAAIAGYVGRSIFWRLTGRG